MSRGAQAYETMKATGVLWERSLHSSGWARSSDRGRAHRSERNQPNPSCEPVSEFRSKSLQICTRPCCRCAHTPCFVTGTGAMFRFLPSALTHLAHVQLCKTLTWTHAFPCNSFPRIRRCARAWNRSTGYMGVTGSKGTVGRRLLINKARKRFLPAGDPIPPRASPALLCLSLTHRPGSKVSSARADTVSKTGHVAGLRRRRREKKIVTHPCIIIVVDLSVYQRVYEGN